MTANSQDRTWRSAHPASFPDAIKNEVQVFSLGEGVAVGEKPQRRRGQQQLGFGISGARGLEIALMRLGDGEAVEGADIVGLFLQSAARTGDAVIKFAQH